MNFKRVSIVIGVLIIIIGTGMFFMNKNKTDNYQTNILKSDTSKFMRSSINEGSSKFLLNIGSEPPQSYTSLLDGKDTFTEEEEVFVAMIDNHRAARENHIGIGDAKIIFEMPAEGGIPRIAALFELSQDIETIGPIRSVRPYFLDVLSPFRPILAHAGGSDKALEELYISTDLLDMDNELGQNNFWRDEDVAAPHNLFTSSENIRNFAEEREWNKPLQTSAFEFQNAYFEGESIQQLAVDFGMSVNLAFWEWDEDTQLFNRKQNSETLDITAANVIVIISEQWPIGDDDKNRIEVTTTGEGDAAVFRDGKMIKGTWKREEDGFFEFYDEEGVVIPLSRGVTFFEFIDREERLRIKK